MKSDDIVSTLNGLIRICKDNEEDLQLCLHEPSNFHSALKLSMMERQSEYAVAAKELQQLVHEEGGIPEAKGCGAGALRRGWFNFITVISGKNNDVILNDCARSERLAQQVYVNALAHDLPNHIRFIVDAQYQDVLLSLERIRFMRNRIHFLQSREWSSH